LPATYAHLAYRFYPVVEEGLDHWVADYQWLAVHLGIKVLTELRRAKDQLKEAHEELKHAGYIFEYCWDGWRIMYRPGHVWKGEQLRRQSGKKRRKHSQEAHSVNNTEAASAPKEVHDPLIATLVAFAANLPVAQERLKSLGLSDQQAIALCLENNIPMRDR